VRWGRTGGAWAWAAASLLVGTATLANEPDPEAWGRTCSVRGGVVAFTEGGAVWRVNGETRTAVKLPTGDRLERAWCTDFGDDIVALYEVEEGEGGTGYLIRISPRGLVWSVNVLGFSFAEPLMAGDSVFVASPSTATRIDLGSGRIRWQRARLRQGYDLASKPRLEGSRLILSATRSADDSPAPPVELDARRGVPIRRPGE